MYLMMQFAQIKQSVYHVQPIWSNSLQCSSPVLFSSSGIRSIAFVNKSNTAIFKETVMIILRIMLKNKWLHMFLSSFDFPIILLVIIPAESKFISGRTYVLQSTYFTGK